MIIAFDIHGVLFTSDYKKIFLLLLHNLGAFKLVIYCAHPRFIRDVLRLLKKGAVPEEYINTLTKSYPGLNPYKGLALEIANAQKPNLPLFTIIKTLQHQGHTLHIFSNIGGTIFSHLAEQYPELLHYFDKICVPTEQNNYVAKPSLDAFKHYLANYNPDNKTIVFIDNRQANITISQRCGMHGIHFKSTADLEEQLALLHKNSHL